MKKILFNLVLLTICLTGLAITTKAALINIYAYGKYEIYDPEYSGITYDVYAYIQVVGSSTLYPCSVPGNPFAQGKYEGIEYDSGDLYFYNIPEQEPPQPMYPYRVWLRAVRNSPYSGEAWRASDWAGQYGLQPWAPSPITIEFSD